MVAQLVEQYTFNVWVLGSSPSGITKKLRIQKVEFGMKNDKGHSDVAFVVLLFDQVSNDSALNLSMDALRQT